MREWSHIRSDREGNARSELLLEFPDLVVEQLTYALRLDRRRRMLCKVLEQRERRDSRDMLLLHDPHRLVAELRGMVDGNHACLGGIERAGLAHCMYGNDGTQARRLVDRRLELNDRVLIRCTQHAVAHAIRTRLVYLHEI